MAKPYSRAVHLSKTQVDFYNENGYIVLENFATQQETRSLQVAAQSILDAFNPDEHRSVFSTKDQSSTSDDYFLKSGDKIRCFFEADAFHPDGSLKVHKNLSINKIGHAMHELDPAFKKFADSTKFKQLCSSVGFKLPRLVQSMYIFKQPRIGGTVQPHQDSTFLFTEPDSVIGFWVALEDATKSNGCLWAIPGSHRLGPLSRFKRTADNKKTYFDPPMPKYDLKGSVPLEVPRGSLVVLHGALVHYSEDNLSDASRHAYTLHVLEGEGTKYPSSNWLQREDGKDFPTFTC